MGRQGDGVVQRVDYPAQDHFGGGPRGAFTIFLVEAGSWRWTESLLSNGQITVSKVCRRARLTLRRVRVPPCTIPKKSLT
jgi:hypothetical protein